jgi:hypothetical protein
VSKVSVSRSALAPQDGQVVLMNVSSFFSGEPVASTVTSVGSTTGRSAAGTGTAPQLAQLMIGIGQPQ